MRVNLMTMPLPEIEELVVAWGFPKFRAKQIQGWIRDKGVSDFDDMNNLPKKLRQTLTEHARLGSLELAVQADSKDGTIKRAYRLHDGQLIESVLMPYDDGRNTACISSQAGCAMGCVFCAVSQTMISCCSCTVESFFAQHDCARNGSNQFLLTSLSHTHPPTPTDWTDGICQAAQF